ncbi:MAG: integrase family protein [Acidithiobacillus sp.]|nr:integrase family protein [Acidithiobacillus sp.]
MRDGDGLEIRILPSGRKVWQFRYTFQEKRKVLSFGDYHGCSLKEARVLAQQARSELLQGIDPGIKRKAAKGKPTDKGNATEEQREKTLADLMGAYAEWKQQEGKVAYAQDVRNTTKRYILEGSPTLAQMAASALRSEDIAALIRPIHERGKIRMAAKLRSMLAAAFQAAFQAPFHPGLPKSLLGFNVQANPVLALPAGHGEARNRVLNQEEIGKYLSALLQGTGYVNHCLTLALFAGGQRPLQVARLSNADYLKDEGILILRDPKGKRRTPRLHHLPIGPKAQKLIESWVSSGQLSSPLWFSMDGETPMSPSSLIHHAAKIQKRFDMAPFQVRDVRRTVETEMARMGFSKDLRAHLLSHGLGGIQDRHYDRYDRIDEKREALIRWEQYLLTLC